MNKIINNMYYICAQINKMVFRSCVISKKRKKRKKKKIMRFISSLCWVKRGCSKTPTRIKLDKNEMKEIFYRSKGNSIYNQYLSITENDK